MIALTPLVVVEMPTTVMKEKKKALIHMCCKPFYIQITLRTKCVRLIFCLFLTKPLHISVIRSVLGFSCV